MEKKITIGMASYNNPEQVWWTIQSLRMYHDLTDCEIIVIDNAGNESLKNWCEAWGGELVRYISFTEKRGTAIAKEQVFVNARGEFVVCIDSHVMLSPGAIDRLKMWIGNNKGSKDLYHAPLVYDGLDCYVDHMDEVWRGGMLGIWGDAVKELPSDPYEIPMHGMGFFGCFKDAWLHFNHEFIGFGGEEGYIHRKYKLAGHKIMCLPFVSWLHRFHDQISGTTYPNVMEERIRNYVIGWSELGIDIKEIQDNFPGFKIELLKEHDEHGIKQHLSILPVNT